MQYRPLLQPFNLNQRAYYNLKKKKEQYGHTTNFHESAQFYDYINTK